MYLRENTVLQYVITKKGSNVYLSPFWVNIVILDTKTFHN